MPSSLRPVSPAHNPEPETDPFGFPIDWPPTEAEDLAGMAAWLDEEEAALLRELEADERIGNDFDHEEN